MKLPFDEEDVRRWAGDTIFRRGKRYLKEGMVESVEVIGDRVEATVLGSYEPYYSVEIRLGEKPEPYCTCPYDEPFCKHVVAVLLYLLEEDKVERISLKDIRKHLQKWPKDRLISLITDLINTYPGARKYVITAVQSDLGSSSAEKALLRDIRRMYDPDLPEQPGTVVKRYRKEIKPRIEVLLKERGPEAVEPLLREVVRKLVDAASFYTTDNVYDAFYDALKLHLKVLNEMEQIPESFIDFVIDLRKMDDGIAGDAAMEEYEHILTSPTLIDRAVEKFLAAGLQEEVEDLYINTGNYEKLRELIGEPDSPYEYRRLIHALENAGRYEEALALTEEGLKKFPDSDELKSSLKDLYVRLGRYEDAFEILKSRFVCSPSYYTYEELKRFAKEYGFWNEGLKGWVLEVMERSIRPLDKAEVFAELGDHERLKKVVPKLVELVQSSPSYSDTALSFLERIAASDPNYAYEVVMTYGMVESLIDMRERKYYEMAAEVLKKAREWVTRGGYGKEFEEYMRELKETHRKKRALMEILKREGL